ncbi:MAG: fimbrillin family protein [Muribaculaceae bacterium]|nr:fimbrillin family protein [Muribaculaceae bacterium]
MKKYILLAAVAFTLTACSSEDSDMDQPIVAQISATIGESVQTRASDITWDNNDNIGVSMGNLYTNVKYTTENADGKFTGSSMYFRNKQDQLSISAYYPFTGTENSAPGIVEASTRMDRQTTAEQPKFDFLYARVDNVTGAAPNINFAFKHQMCKLTLIFQKGNDGTDVSKINSLRIEGLVLDGTFNTATGECTAKNVSAAPIEMTPTVEHNAKLPYLILFPQSVGKVTLKISDSEEQEYSCELKFPDNRLVSGNHYVYTIVVKKTALNVEQSTISDWTETFLTSEGESE